VVVEVTFMNQDTLDEPRRPEQRQDPDSPEVRVVGPRASQPFPLGAQLVTGVTLVLAGQAMCTGLEAARPGPAILPIEILLGVTHGVMEATIVWLTLMVVAVGFTLVCTRLAPVRQRSTRAGRQAAQERIP
jgi:hypothetical protein